MDIINTLTEKSLAKYFDHTFLKAYATRADFEKLCRKLGSWVLQWSQSTPHRYAFAKSC